MKILFTHNSYQNPGGEDSVVDAEVALLRRHGHEVEVYRRHNDEIGEMSSAQAASTTFWSRRTAHDIGQVCDVFRPEVIHTHNTFPLISPSLYWTAAEKNVPVVQTLHNFRLLCPAGAFLREGKVCEDCVGKVPWRAVTRKCYRESTAQSAVLAGMLTAHRAIGTYRDKITFYIALNDFCRDKFVEGGLPASRLRIKPNFVECDILPDWSGRHGGLFVGRLTAEKGLEVLIGAARTLGSAADIDVIGGGPYEKAVTKHFGDRYLGFMSRDKIMTRMRSAQYLILPSISYESAPCTIVEAFACGLPVIASRMGPLVEMVKDGVTGLLFNPGIAGDLASTIAWAASHPEQMLEMGKQARAEYEDRYTPHRNHDMLIDIYQDAIESVRWARHAA